MEAENLDVEFFPSFLDHKAADTLFAQMQNLAWRHETIQMFGKNITVPRKVLWIADSGIHYTYSGLSHAPDPWPPFLLPILERLKHEIGPFNSVLCNQYLSGRDYMGWHSDDEPELGPEPLIASLSLGAERRFLFRRKRDHHKIEYSLTHGSLLTMFTNAQQEWQHSLPKTAKPLKERINLTFRLVIR